MSSGINVASVGGRVKAKGHKLDSVACFAAQMESAWLTKARELVKPDLPMQQFQILLLVASHPGITSLEVRQTLNITGGSLTRNSGALSQMKDHKGEMTGLKLIEIKQNLDNRRLFEYHLTDKGREVMSQLMSSYLDMVKGIAKKLL